MRSSSIELFSDYFAQSENVFTAIDARVKLVFISIALALVLIGHSIAVLLIVPVLSMGALISVRIPPKTILARLAGSLLMAAIIFILQAFVYGNTPFHVLHVGGLHLVMYREGIGRGMLIAGRVLAGTSLMILFSMTTPINKILGALKYFRVPDGWLEVTAFTYRYIFVFIEEAQSIMDSQRLRLGYSGVRTGLRSWGTLVGSLFTRVYDQANATHEAMIIRGYNGTLHIKLPDHIAPRDTSAGLLLAVVLLIMALAGFYWG
ncbi:MAG: cobalt ECF transporter T component CbiQ [Candidatus Aquicultor sp.]